ncbi:MAG: Gfo/Idh/MocA family oxidoreductase [Anaerolineae bacterium]|nr:Gfo/Idh/MocA family oxidoreductase [Anaerolineae bacterium]
MSEPIRLALIGAGLFVRDAHIPALVALSDRYRVIAVASRTLESAQARAAEFPYPVEATDNLPALLNRDDIEAIDVVLPIQVQPPVLEMALKSGKHVISEKPIARSVAEGQQLIAQHTSGSQWTVAENFRYEAAYIRAAELVAQGAIGRPLVANWTMYSPLNPGDKYYETPWRRAGDFPGGFLLDGGVHWVAAFRLILGEIVRVSGFAALTREDTPPLNALTANFEFASGCIANYSALFGAAPGGDYSTGLTISSSEGLMQVLSDRVTITQGSETHSFKVSGADSVQAELAAFADSLRDGKLHRNSPQQALQDTAVIEALLQSADSGQAERVALFANKSSDSK